MFENRVIDKALLHYKGGFPERLNDAREDKGLKNAHMVANKDAWSIQVLKGFNVVDLDPDSNGFYCSEGAQTVVGPGSTVVSPSPGQIIPVPILIKYPRVERQVGKSCAQPGDFPFRGTV